MKSAIAVVVAILTFIVAAPTIWAGDDVSDAKTRMSARLGIINTLKQSQKVGEGNKGYLVVLKNTLTAAEKAEVEKENDDRKLVYAYIAEKTGSTVQLVAERRARKIAASSAPGTVCQDASGNWVTK